MSIRRTCYLTLLSLLSLFPAFAQQPAQKPQVFFSDLDNFWVAYDSIRTAPDSLRQLGYLQRLYIAKATPGLKSMVEVRGYTAPEYVHAIRRYPKFWNSLRPFTRRAPEVAAGLEPYLKKLKQLYPALRPAPIYFTVGLFRSGGTIKDGAVLIGSELTLGGPGLDLSEFPPAVRAARARSYQGAPVAKAVLTGVHEYVHTQEKEPGDMLLSLALYEGTCDMIAELVTGRVPAQPYMTYGPAHEAQLKEQFKAEMFTPAISNWFYNPAPDDPAHVSDLGYYLGYAIGKAYYGQAKDKPAALKRLIELDYGNDAAVEAFLRETHYYPGPLDKAQLLRAYAAHNPVVVSMTPAPSPDGFLDASVKELRFTFSAPMSPNTGTGLGPGGREQFPVTGRVGFSADQKSYTYKVDLRPGHAYGFVLESGFKSLDGHPLVPYQVAFKTKE
ncbi:Ig-like domain-containing protein [Hymenobacter ruricola]|uniref:Ig-like domain-containing protein n=1 Tax=Hymenobacter ruricola TaxID=2791023 RepID=A0ABS0I5Z5_9BACT|nr:Ig-like domain-containing protein [Hymenobacter ruricola]MBF9221984.1 Ig-like domain-containing protein [Hymenobacter ruricola]